MNILVTSIGSFSADCVIKTLRAHGHSVIGCDIYPSNWHATSKDCNNVYLAPLAINENEYVSFLLDISMKEDIDCILPLTDVEIDVLNRNRNAFADSDTSLFIQSPKCLDVARNKYTMYLEFCDDKKVNVPYSVNSLTATEDFHMPAIAKPINGRNSEGLKHLTSKEELSTFINKPNYLIQQMIPGPIYTVDYVRDNYNNDFAVAREELLRTKNGAGLTVRIVANDLLTRTTSHIGFHLDIIGCVNMEFIYNDNKFYLIDINPRFSAGVAFSKLAGYDMVTSHLNSFTGKKICPHIKIEEHILYKRYYEEAL